MINDTTRDNLGQPGTTEDNQGQPRTTKDNQGQPRTTYPKNRFLMQYTLFRAYLGHLEAF